MADSGTPKTTDRTTGDNNKILQLDTGILIAITDTSTTYVHIYRPPASNPPSGFSSSYVYYYIQNGLPTSSATLTTTVTNPSGSPGFAASSAVKAPHTSFTNQNRKPGSSASLWVDSSQNWAFDWIVTGTGTGADGTVTWWNNSATVLSPSSGSISNFTSVNNGVTYSAVDDLGP